MIKPFGQVPALEDGELKLFGMAFLIFCVHLWPYRTSVFYMLT